MRWCSGRLRQCLCRPRRVGPRWVGPRRVGRRRERSRGSRKRPRAQQRWLGDAVAAAVTAVTAAVTVTAVTPAVTAVTAVTPATMPAHGSARHALDASGGSCDESGAVVQYKGFEVWGSGSGFWFLVSGFWRGYPTLLVFSRNRIPARPGGANERIGVHSARVGGRISAQLACQPPIPGNPSRFGHCVPAPARQDEGIVNSAAGRENEICHYCNSALGVSHRVQ